MSVIWDWRSYLGLAPQKTVAKRNLGTAVRKATLAANENRREISRVTVYRRGLGIFLTETPLPEAPKHFFRPLFPRTPLFPALRSDPMALSGASRRKQIPSSQKANS